MSGCRLWSLVLVLGTALVLLSGGLLSTSAHDVDSELSIDLIWARTDKPVADGQVNRPWVWGAAPLTRILHEPYADAPNGLRDAQYYDNGRLEIINLDANPDDDGYIRPGKIVAELVTGRIELGGAETGQLPAADISVAGGVTDATGVTYSTLGNFLAAAPAVSEGTIINTHVDRAGNITFDPALADFNVVLAGHEPVSGHNVAEPFQAFIDESGVVYADGQFRDEAFFPVAEYATGLPLTEPYWTAINAASGERLVLVQCFERRCLIYTPDADPGQRVTSARSGRDYLNWRYNLVDFEPLPPPELPVNPSAEGNGAVNFLVVIQIAIVLGLVGLIAFVLRQAQSHHASTP